MDNFIIEKIEQAKRKNTYELVLQSNQLYEFPKEILACKNLKTLEISFKEYLRNIISYKGIKYWFDDPDKFRRQWKDEPDESRME